MASVERFDPRLATPEEWEQLHHHRRRAHAECRSEEPFQSDDIAEARMRREDPMEIGEYLWRRDGGEVSAFAQVMIPRPGSPGYESNRGILWFHLYVLREWRGRGIGRSLLADIVEIARRYEGRVLGTDADEEAAKRFLEGHGFESRSQARYSRLDLESLDWARVEEWAEEGRRRSPERNLTHYLNGPPEAELATYCAAMTELFNTIPWDDIDHGDIVLTPETVLEQAAHLEGMGAGLHRLLVHESDGRMTGVTEMLHVPGSEPEHAHQWLTAVHRSAQGNGVGRWIKCEMLLHIHRLFPRVRWVLTDNASSNNHMLKINTELGFQPYRIDTTYQAPVAGLEARLQAQR